MHFKNICEIQCTLQVTFASSIKLTMALKFLKKIPIILRYHLGISMNNNNSNNTIIHIPTCGLWSSCHLASLVLPAPGTHPHIHTAHSPPTLLYVCAAAAVGWCISPYFSSVVSGGRASRATIHTYIHTTSTTKQWPDPWH